MVCLWNADGGDAGKPSMLDSNRQKERTNICCISGLCRMDRQEMSRIQCHILVWLNAVEGILVSWVSLRFSWGRLWECGRD